MTGTGVLLGRLGNRGATILGSVCIIRSRLLTHRCLLFIVRLLVVVRVVEVLVKLHGRLVLVVMMNRLGLLSVWWLRRLHHTVGWWGRVLALVLMLVGSVGRHLGVTVVLRWGHLLVIVRGLVRLVHLIHARTARDRQGMVAGVGDRARTVRVEGRVRGLTISVGSSSATGRVVTTLFVVLVPLFGALVLAAPHAHITSNANTAALFSDHAAQSGAFTETREFLRGEDSKGCRFDLGTMGDKVVAVIDDIWVFRIQVFQLAQVLEERKAQAVLALMAYRQVWEDEVACRRWAVEIGHASDRRPGENREAGRSGRRAAGCDGARILKTGVEEEVRIVGEGDFLVVLEDAQLDNRGRVNRAAVGARLCAATAGTSALWLLDHLEIVANLAAILGRADRRALGLVADGNGGSHGEQWVGAATSQHVAWSFEWQQGPFPARNNGSTGLLTSASPNWKSCTRGVESTTEQTQAAEG